jgi:serine/threonine-protein kinase
MELYPGAVVAGRYRLERKIGAGGMGEVWAGEHVNIGVRVALKTLLPAAALDQRLVARFRREAQLLGRMRSDRVARVVDFVEDGQFGLVLVMDYVEGELLGSVLAARRLGVEEAIDLGIDIATALCDLHRAKVVHRDLKPDNIILEPISGGHLRAVIVDLGVSRLESGPAGDDSVTSITQVDMAVGTLPYMAPEQLLGSSTATGSADLYAVGAILYRAVSGEQVFGDDDDAAAARRKITGEAPPLELPRIDRVARGLAAVVARALQRRPEQRFETAEEMLRELIDLRDVSRALAFDLDAATEEALPPSSMGPVPASSDDPSGERTRLMSRPPMEDDTVFDEATSPSSSPLSQRYEEPIASSTPVTSAPLRPTRPTVLSPILAEALPMGAPSDPSPPSAAATSRRAPRTVSLQAAVIGLIAALAAGTALGFEAHRMLLR